MNILDLTQFKNLKELQDYADKQFKTIAIMKNKIDDQTAKIQHLESSFWLVVILSFFLFLLLLLLLKLVNLKQHISLRPHFEQQKQ